MKIALQTFIASAIALSATYGAAQPYSLNWFTVDGGGHTSTGGVYAISGTVGQFDVGPRLTNGVYTVIGGFWVLPAAIQTPGAPVLHIVAAGPNQATISWSPVSPGVVLQETTSLSPTNWVNSPSGAMQPVTVSAVGPMKFYRLFKP